LQSIDEKIQDHATEYLANASKSPKLSIAGGYIKDGAEILPSRSWQ
jgi:hypothetical protein